MVAKLPWGAINHLTDQGITDAMHRCGTPEAWPISQPSGQRQTLTLVEAAAPAEDATLNLSQKSTLLRE